ncbi:unnamed protein product [Phaedon cochleariae]|uniref:Protein phosphatase 1 regulatory subunit 37 n=1 Tax=Phaedon cochleariae TaxID=80249 RepID=A0A9P0GNW1_PHACE|nr:unnamed protein product [Phaedon cochleariae]
MDLLLKKGNETHLLIDTESKCITGHSLVDTEEQLVGEPAVCKIDIERKLSNQNLLDKAFSIDENDLATPLEPIQVESFPLSTRNGTSSDETSSENSGKSDEDYDYVEEALEEDSNTEPEEDNVDDKVNITTEVECQCENEEILKSNFLIRRGDFSADGFATIPNTIQETEQSTGANHQIYLPRTSILKPQSSECNFSSFQGHRKCSVSFPTLMSLLVTYNEPEYSFPWSIDKEMSADEILQVYQESCKKHKTIELDTIKSQISDIKNNMNHSATMKLHSIKVTSEVNETLEDIFKVTNFHTLILNDCKFTPETMSEFLNMLEYYESACHFEIEMNFEDDDTWKCFCNACNNIMVLESLSFKKMVINETHMRSLLSAIKNNCNITMLKFDSCMLVKLPSFYLVENLMSNTTIRELYLPSTGLYTKEAEILARFFCNNTHLKVLDIGNNFIGDRGLESLARGLCKQNTPGVGLSALSVFNNQITEKSGPIISVIIMECKNLHTLNIGYNNLTDEVLNHLSVSLLKTNCLEGLGLQSTLLTCKGIDALAEVIPNNHSLQKINLKGNKAIQVNGVEKLCQALTNSNIIKIEIDENNRSCSDPEAYTQLVKKLFAICTVNRSFAESNPDDETANPSRLISRKMSLSCEPRFTVPEAMAAAFQVGSPALSPIPSPVASPAPKSRFQIVRVAEAGGGCPSASLSPSPRASPSPKPKSRFRVTKVPASPDEDIHFGKFANIRGSVSSNDSMDSLTTLHLESDSE